MLGFRCELDCWLLVVVLSLLLDTHKAKMDDDSGEWPMLGTAFG